MSTYRPPSVRNFKSFIGELTAEAAAVHLSLLESKKTESNNDKYWSEIAKEAGIKLEGITSDKILNSQTRLSIVSIYSGFDSYLEEIESESKQFGFQWKKPDKTPPIETLEKNFIKTPSNKTDFRYRSDAFDYLRLLRHSIVHPKIENEKKAIEYYKAKKQSIVHMQETYKMVSAPNAPDCLSFHDIKFWCQFLLNFAEEIATLLEPSEKMIYDSIPFGNWKKYGKNSKKLKKAAKNYLHSQYSYSPDKADKIIENFYDSLA